MSVFQLRRSSRVRIPAPEKKQHPVSAPFAATYPLERNTCFCARLSRVFDEKYPWDAFRARPSIAFSVFFRDNIFMFSQTVDSRARFHMSRNTENVDSPHVFLITQCSVTHEKRARLLTALETMKNTVMDNFSEKALHGRARNTSHGYFSLKTVDSRAENAYFFPRDTSPRMAR